jgi:hypothetical protein
MKLLAPQGTSSISIAGESFEIAVDGTVEVSSSATANELCDSFGFTKAGEKPAAAEVKQPADKFTDMSRAELIGYIKSKGLPVVPSTDNDTLRATARTQYSPEERAADEAAVGAAKAKG